VSNDLDGTALDEAAETSPEEGAAEIFALLRTLGRRTARRADQCGGPGDVPSASWMLLHHLRQSPGQTVSGLARVCGISKSRVSVLADELHGRGLLEKRPDPEDQRVLRLYLTERVREMWGPAAFREAMIELVADLDAAERQQLLAVLRKMRAGAERRGW